MRYFKAKKGLFQLRYIYGKLRYPVHFVLTGFFCKSFIYKVLKGFFGVVYVHFIMLLLTGNILETLKIKADNAPSRAQKIVQLDDVIFATTRPSQMRIALIPEVFDGQIASTGYCILRADKVNVLPKWIFFVLSTTEFKKFIEENQSGTAYPAISDGKLKEFKIPLPPLEEQQRIATILDKFDTLVNSIGEGLPKEIALRRKQYEYYREKLLTFTNNQ